MLGMAIAILTTLVVAEVSDSLTWGLIVLVGLMSLFLEAMTRPVQGAMASVGAGLVCSVWSWALPARSAR